MGRLSAVRACVPVFFRRGKANSVPELFARSNFLVLMYTLIRALLLGLVLTLVGGCAQFGPKRPPAPTLDEVVAQSKAGVPSATIIQRMRESYAVYPLSAADFARLHDQGVADEVLNYMQAVYLEEVRRDEAWRSRYRYDPWFGPWWGFGPYWH